MMILCGGIPRKMTRAAHALTTTVTMIVIAGHLRCRKFLAGIDNSSRRPTLYPGIAGGQRTALISGIVFADQRDILPRWVSSQKHPRRAPVPVLLGLLRHAVSRNPVADGLNLPHRQQGCCAAQPN